jgi:hypothetical protein
MAAGGYDAAPVAAPVVSGADATPTLETVTTTTVTVTTETTIQPQQIVQPEPPPYALLTAASVGDHDRRENYLSFLSRHPFEARYVRLDMTRRVRVRVVDAHGRPVNDAAIRVSGPGMRGSGRSHGDGIWDYYPGVFGDGSGRATLVVSADQRQSSAVIDVPSVGDGQEVTIRLTDATAIPPRVLDLGFAIDVTGSMEDELRYINAEIGGIVRRIQQESPETIVRVGATFYRDRTDRLVVQQIPFTTDVRGFAAAMEGVSAMGGGDYPEDMNAGLEASFSRLEWSAGNAVRVLVLVADAPPKPYADAQFTYVHALQAASDRGVRVLPVAASGADRTVEYLFRAMAAFTSTPYVYLTDDSGIGNPHQEADTDRVAVEYFSDLLTRLIISDLGGRGMHEPGVFGPRA